MALPTAIHTGINSGSISSNGNRRVGPFKSAGGSWYVVTLAQSGGSFTGAIQVMKASDPENGTWTEQDSADRPSPGVSGSGMSWDCVVSDDMIHIASQHITTDMTPAGAVRYHAFNMATDQWATVNETVVSPTNIGSNTGVTISIRTAGPVIAYQTSQASVMGNVFRRIALATKSGSTWTAGIGIDAGGETHYAISFIIVDAASGRTVILYHNTSGGDLLFRTYSSANAFDTAQTAVSSSSGWAAPIIYTDGVSKFLSASAVGAGGVPITFVTCDVGADPTLSTATTPVNASILSSLNTLVAVTGRHGSTNYLLFISNSDADLYITSNSGSGWGSPTAVEASITGNRISANVYTRGNTTVFGYTIQKADLEYNEYLIDAGTPKSFLYNRRRSIRSMLVR